MNFNGQAFERQDIGHVERNEKWILAARDAPLAAADVAREFRLLRGQALVKWTAKLFMGGGEQGAAAAERAHVVAQYFAFPFRIEQVLPALGLVGGLDEIGVGENAEVNHVDRNARAIGGELGCSGARHSAACRMA